MISHHETCKSENTKEGQNVNTRRRTAMLSLHLFLVALLLLPCKAPTFQTLHSSYIVPPALFPAHSSVTPRTLFLHRSSYAVPHPFSSCIAPPTLFILHSSPAFLSYMPPTSLILHSFYTVPPSLLLLDS